MPGPARPARPGMPIIGVPSDGSQVEYIADTSPMLDNGEQVIVADDDDSVNVPPPPTEYLGHTHHVQPAGSTPMQPRYQSIGHKQALIPILIVTGLCMFALGACRWICPEDTTLGSLPMLIPIAMFVFGTISMAFGIFTMLQVGNALRRQKADRAARAAAVAAA